MNKTPYQATLEMAQSMLQSQPTTTLTREAIEAAVDRVLSVMPAWKNEVDSEGVVRELETRFSIWIGRTQVLEDNDGHEAWLNAERRRDWRLWSRYRQYLEESWSPVAVDALDEATDEVLSRIEDPNRPGTWDRRGMVVGNVQSGKTANYAGLICKAADAGYRVIIVLAGLHNNLRSQTQMRLDETFLGYETAPHRGSSGELRTIGVGLIDSGHEIRPDFGTNRTETGDFKRAVTGVSFTPGSRPVLFVVKKNKSVLQNLWDWFNGLEGGRPLASTPLLLVDDEADNASVDTGEQAFDEEGNPDPEHSPKEINAQIRRLLLKFERRAYIGYTATPFANIFIHDRGWTSKFGPDLFPRSFIVNLPTPSNYDGPVRIFGLEPDKAANEEGRPSLPLIRTIDDYCGPPVPPQKVSKTGWMPVSHKKVHRPTYHGEDSIPPSLHQAILAFILVCAARRARGAVAVHNSMLVHVTRFTDVQALVKSQVERALASVQQQLKFGDVGSSGARASLEHLWRNDFESTTREVLRLAPEVAAQAVSWQAISPLLISAAEDIVVRAVNGSAKDVLEYDERKNTGFNVIAIGGDKLSRGLTLEGLSVSYFLRATKMYDTLMQMGRWFGYRPGYLDLCRLYTTSELEEWFEHVTEASEELRREFDHMQAVGGTPRDYGLKVQSHPAMMVTSRVKMKHSTPMTVTFSGAIQETVTFHTSGDDLRANRAAATELLHRLGPGFEKGPSRERPGGTLHRWSNSYAWTSVDGSVVADFLASYRTHPEAVKANSKLLSDYIREQMGDGKLANWHVALLGGAQALCDFGGLECKLTLRETKEEFGTPESGGRYTIRRILAPRDEAIDLGKDDYSEALTLTQRWWAEDRDRSRRNVPPTEPSGAAFRAIRGQRHPERGLLLLYLLQAPTTLTNPVEGPVVGWGLSFPADGEAKPVTYMVNNIYYAQEMGADL